MAKKLKAAVDFNNLNATGICSVLNERYGANTAIVSAEAKGLQVEFISTGSFELDFVIGGGFPENRITEMRGKFSSFKSTITLMGMANFHAKYRDGIAVYFDLEKSYDADYSSRFGVSGSRTIIVNADSGEQAGDILPDVFSANVPVFVVVDSIAALVPTGEIEATMDSNFQGLHPRLVGRIMRTCTQAIKRNMYDKTAPSTTIVCINQYREKITTYGNPESSPGGHAKDHYYSLIVRLAVNKSDAEWSKKSIKIGRKTIERSIRVAQNVKFSITKNKVGKSQFEEGELKMHMVNSKEYKAMEFNNADVLVNWAVITGVVKLSAIEYDEVSYTSVDGLKKAVLSDADLRNALYEDILVTLRSDENWAEKEEEEEEEEETPIAPKKMLTKKAKIAKI